MANYCSYAEATAQRVATGSGALTQATVEAMIADASAMIDQYCGVEGVGFLAPAGATTREYFGTGQTSIPIDWCIDVDLVEVRDLGEAYVALAATDWFAFSGSHETPNPNRLPYTGLMTAWDGDYDIWPNALVERTNASPARRRVMSEYGRQPTVRVTARWGYAAAVPADVKQACLMTVVQMAKRAEGAFSTSIGPNEIGEVGIITDLDPQVKRRLNPYRRVMIAGWSA